MTFWDLYNFGIPTVLMLLGYIAVRLHEWDLDRKHGHPPPGE